MEHYTFKASGVKADFLAKLVQTEVKDQKQRIVADIRSILDNPENYKNSIKYTIERLEAQLDGLLTTKSILDELRLASKL